MPEEYFPLVDESGKLIGKATRKDCHSGTFWLHPVVHLHVFNSAGQLYLQKRSMTKDVQPGKWDTSVGGHIDYGETVDEALRREVCEELGITDFKPHALFVYKHTSKVESELVNVFSTVYDGPVTFDPVEISEGHFWTIDEIKQALGKDIFTPNFEVEFPKVLKVLNLNS